MVGNRDLIPLLCSIDTYSIFRHGKQLQIGVDEHGPQQGVKPQTMHTRQRILMQKMDTYDEHF